MPLNNAVPELCAACQEPVNLTEGVQCQGPCGRWRHYRCLDVSACKIQAVKTGELVLRCPCPDCEPDTQVWQAPCCKGQPCPTSKGLRSSITSTNIDSTIETTSYKQLPEQMLNKCKLSQCISPTTCPDYPSESDERYSKVGSNGQKQKILPELRGFKTGPGEGTKSSDVAQAPDRRNRDHDEDRRRSQRDAENLNQDPGRTLDERHRKPGELTKTDSSTYRGDRAFSGTERGYGGSYERGSQRVYGLERSYAGGGSDKTGRSDTDLRRKSEEELKSSTQDLKLKQEVVMKCFESVRLLFEAVDHLSRKITEVVEDVIVTLQENDPRFEFRRPSANAADTRGRMCHCPQNPKQ